MGCSTSLRFHKTYGSSFRDIEPATQLVKIYWLLLRGVQRQPCFYLIKVLKVLNSSKTCWSTLKGVYRQLFFSDHHRWALSKDTHHLRSQSCSLLISSRGISMCPIVSCLVGFYTIPIVNALVKSFYPPLYRV